MQMNYLRILRSHIFSRQSICVFRTANRIVSTDATGNPETEEKSESNEKELTAKIEDLTEKINELDDKFKRALAEAENTRVYLKRQIEETRIFAISKFCKDLLDVADTLQKAVEMAPKWEEIDEEKYKSVVSGVSMTEQSLQNVFQRHGLTRIDPSKGQKFDPNEHHAMYSVEDESMEPGTVCAVQQIGYRLHSRTIRPAMVGVFKSK